MKYTLAISPCPNDTFMMSGILTGAVQCPGIELDVSLMDIQELNTAAADERFDFCKVSSVAAMQLQSVYELCSSGAALGYGVGPMLLKRPDAPDLAEGAQVLCPGASTTAHALFTYFYPQSTGCVRQVVFSEIMPALVRGEADYGVVIHEGRFTYESYGLQKVVDLGALWEGKFALPLPLGCVVAHRRVRPQVRHEFEVLVKDSIEYGYQNRQLAYETMKRLAQELSSEAIWAHVDLYVNQWSLALGDDGKRAFIQLGALRS